MKRCVIVLSVVMVLAMYLTGSLGFGIHHCDRDGSTRVVLLNGTPLCDHHGNHHHCCGETCDSCCPGSEETHDDNCCHTRFILLDPSLDVGRTITTLVRCEPLQAAVPTAPIAVVSAKEITLQNQWRSRGAWPFPSGGVSLFSLRL